MDDLTSEVVGSAHEVGAWRGPTRGPWLQRIVTGAGFTAAWDEGRLLGGGSAQTRARATPPDRAATAGRPSPEERPAPEVPDHAPLVDPFRLWWLPRAHEP